VPSVGDYFYQQHCRVIIEYVALDIFFDNFKSLKVLRLTIVDKKAKNATYFALLGPPVGAAIRLFHFWKAAVTLRYMKRYDILQSSGFPRRPNFDPFPLWV